MTDPKPIKLHEWEGLIYIEGLPRLEIALHSLNDKVDMGPSERVRLPEGGREVSGALHLDVPAGSFMEHARDCCACSEILVYPESETEWRIEIPAAHVEAVKQCGAFEYFLQQHAFNYKGTSRIPSQFVPLP